MFRCLSTTTCLASGPLHLFHSSVKSPFPIYIAGPFSLSSSQLQHRLFKEGFPNHPIQTECPFLFSPLLFHFILLIAILHIYLFVGTFSCLLSTFLLYHEKFKGRCHDCYFYSIYPSPRQVPGTQVAIW